MEDIIRSSDLTSTMQKMKTLDARLTELTTELAKWKVYVAVSVQPTPTGTGLQISIAKNNGQGFIHAVSAEDVAHYAADPETLVSIIVDKVFENLYKEQVRNEITPAIVRAIGNAVKVKS